MKMSSSVINAIEKLGQSKEITAVDLAKAIFSQHATDYARGRVANIKLKDTHEKRLAMDWINDIQTLFIFSSDKEPTQSSQGSESSIALPMLDGRLAIIGLCLLDKDFRTQLIDLEIFQPLIEELKAPIDKILTDRGRKLYSGGSEISIAARLLADTAEIDLLKFSDYADAFTDFIRNKSSSEPLIIGIDAAWGMGKSTLMGMIKDRLKSSYPTVWFNAWKYDQEESLWSALVLEILSQTSSKIGLRERFLFYLQKINKKMIALLIIEIILLIILGLILLTILHYQSLQLMFGNNIIVDLNYEKLVNQKGLAYVILLFILGVTFFKDFLGPLDLKMDRYIQKNDYEQRIGFLANFSKEFNRVVNMIVRRRCVFSWDGVPGTDNDKLIDFLWQKRQIDWIYSAKFEKIDDNRTIKASKDKKSIYLRLNNKRTKVVLKGEGISDYEFVAEIENEAPSPFSMARLKQLWSSDHKQEEKLMIYEKTDYPLVVFIDDLDRCTPPQSADIIEAINLLLDAKNCVFILGMDGKAVASSIEAKYEKLKDCYKESGDSTGYLLGQRFLEKIIQIKFFIPKIDEKLMEFYADSIRRRPDKPEMTNQPEKNEKKIQEYTEYLEQKIREGKSRERANDAAEKSMPDTDSSIKEEARKRAFANSWENSVEVEKAISGVLKYLDSNPRKVKRFINLFKLQSYIADRRMLLKENNIQLDLLAKWAVISLQWPELIQAIIYDEEFMSRFKNDKLPGYFNSKNVQESSDLIELLGQYPKEKLSDYIFLSRTGR